jgi:hypothetical protein
MNNNTDQGDTRRTKRRYAHELYPHPEEGEPRDLAIEVPYLIAHANGLTIHGTGWMQAEPRTAAGDRVALYLHRAHLALLADAIHQGLVGQEAWDWADQRCTGDSVGEWLWERAEHYGVDPHAIKPYPCGPEPIDHEHYSHGTYGVVTKIPLRESECADCTEPIEADD